MIKVNTQKWFQVVEYTCAKQMLYWAGLGQRRVDGDTLAVYPKKAETGFYVRKDTTQKTVALMAVDEGHYSNAMHLPSTIHPDDAEMVNSFSLPWCEYVDAVHLMEVLMRKLVPDATIKPSEAIGRGRRQEDLMEQYLTHLRVWSEKNPDHPLKFI